MGAALTVPFTDRCHTVALWCTDHDDEAYHALSSGGPHPSLGTPLPEAVQIFASNQIEDALAGAEQIVLAVSTPGVLPVIRQAAPHLQKTTPILTAAKGFISKNDVTNPVPSCLQLELQNILREAKPPVLCLTGPSIAGELVRRQPTAAAVAGDHHRVAQNVSNQLATGYFWLDAVHDLRGVEVCLAYKNIYSIALAWAGGSNESSDHESTQNLSAILLLQAVDELRKLIKGRHGNPDTANGWSGLGDLVATSGGGRNGRFGHLLATGKSPDEAADILKTEGLTTIEGRTAAPLGVAYAVQTFGSDWAARLPLLHSIEQVLLRQKTVPEVIADIKDFRASMISRVSR